MTFKFVFFLSIPYMSTIFTSFLTISSNSNFSCVPLLNNLFFNYNCYTKKKKPCWVDFVCLFRIDHLGLNNQSVFQAQDQIQFILSLLAANNLPVALHLGWVLSDFPDIYWAHQLVLSLCGSCLGNHLLRFLEIASLPYIEHMILQQTSQSLLV